MPLIDWGPCIIRCQVFQSLNFLRDQQLKFMDRVLLILLLQASTFMLVWVERQECLIDMRLLPYPW